MPYISSVISSKLSYLGLNWNNTTLIHRCKIYSAKIETDKHFSAYSNVSMDWQLGHGLRLNFRAFDGWRLLRENVVKEF